MALQNLEKSKPLQYENFVVSFPHDKIIQITLNRPEKLNSINKSMSHDIQAVWDLLDQDENLWVGIITGSGRAFCTGADLQGKRLTLIFARSPRVNAYCQNGMK
jgi:enoyl-CoA hydratase/carnithine racemase